jgi:hypothetical protein
MTALFEDVSWCSDPLDTHAAAVGYFQRGYTPLRLPPRSKAIYTEGWQETHYESEEELDGVFPEEAPANIGVLLGDGSAARPLDADLDCPEARRLAARFLPPTERISGRKSAPHSHWWYMATGACGGRKEFKDPAVDRDATLLELRGNLCQTVVPPSIHPEDEAYVWEKFGAPGQVEYDELLRCLGELAAAVLLVRHWPGPESHKRQDTAMALAGGLLRAGWSAQQTTRFLDAVVVGAGDPDVRQRVSVVGPASVRLAAGEPVVGWPRLAELVGDRIVSKAREWLGLRGEGTSSAKGHEGDGQADNSSPAAALKPERKSTASRLVALAEGVELFHDSEQTPYATIKINDHQETWPLKNKGFRDWLARRFYQATGRTAGGQAIQDALGVLAGLARFDGPQLAVPVRLAEQAGAIYLDLGDRDWRAVEVSADGWRLLACPPCRFRRPQGLLALPAPTEGGRLEELKTFLNYGAEANWQLLVAWLVQAFRPQGPYPVLALFAEHGSAKSTMGRVLRSLIDPNKANLRSAPKEPRDLLIAATNSWVCCYDNISYLPDWLSDALCRLCTGGGSATRELYTDREEVIFDVQRPVIVNGIEEIVTKSDLLDRNLLLKLARIDKKDRIAERTFWRAFEAARPRLLGVLLTVLSGALRELPSVRLEELPRMADFAEWAVAAGRGRGEKAGTFLAVYEGNREEANEVALDASPLTAPLRELLVKNQGHWEGTATDLLKELTALVPESIAKSKDWPKKPHKLTGKLTVLSPNLRDAGMVVEVGRQPGNTSQGRRTRWVRITQDKAGE